MVKRTILVDVDSTVAMTLPAVLGMLNLEFHTGLCLEDIDEWGALAKKTRGIAMKYFDDPGLYVNVMPFPGAVVALCEFRRFARVVFVTSGAHCAKIDWLIHWGFIADVYDSNLVVATDKSLVKGDILIDDHYDNIVAFPGPGILVEFDGYHYYHRDKWDVTKGHSWSEIVKLTKGALEIMNYGL